MLRQGYFATPRILQILNGSITLPVSSGRYLCGGLKNGSIGSYVWMLGSQLVELFGKDLGGVAFLEKVVSLEGGL